MMQQPASQLNEALLHIKNLFDARNVKYCVIGGYAVGYLSTPRFTKDIDFIVNVPQLVLPRVIEDLITLGFELNLYESIKRWTQEHMMVFQYQGYRIDWLKPVLPLHQHVIDTALETEWNGHSVRFATIESLILLKLLAFRPQDQIDVESLIASKRTALNLPYIDAEWQAIGELSDSPMQWFKERYHHIITGGT